MSERGDSAPLRIVVIGAAGRMGRRVLALAEGLDEVEIVGGVIRGDDPRIGDDAGLIAGTNVLGVPLTGELPGVEADAVIDFSSPAGTRRFVPICAERKLPLVIATTGLGAEHRSQIVEASRAIPVLFAPNLSIGVALLTQLVTEAARALGVEADVEIVEAHHGAKKDAPSGTALHLARAVAEGRGQVPDEVVTNGRSGSTGERPVGQIAIHALRLGDVVGEHTVSIGFGSERLELTHRAHSRDVFALGAIKAAGFISKAKPGLYGLHDLVAAAGARR